MLVKHAKAPMEGRLRFVEIRGDQPHISFCSEVDAGLRNVPKSLPTRFLYDTVGSQLFDRITQLPEYYLTRCEHEIFANSADEIVSAVGSDVSLIEFGSGSSKKTRLLMDAILNRQHRLEYVPIDISADYLQQTSRGLLGHYPALTIDALAAEYFEAIGFIPRHDGPRLILFLGSNIGNFTFQDAVRFLGLLQARMKPVDRLLVGIDLAKDADIITSAYNDGEGLTADFNLNLLRRVNNELEANFELGSFCHSAPYDTDTQRVEMRLYSLTNQVVSVESLGTAYRFAEGEFIHTEWSQKYTLESFEALADRAGLVVNAVWHDPKAWFATVLLSSAG